MDNSERISNASFHSLEYSPTGEYNTLNEPISTSLKREFFRIFNKTQYSILPRCFPSKEANLKQWDLWGPLFYTLLLSFFLAAIFMPRGPPKSSKINEFLGGSYYV